MGGLMDGDATAAIVEADADGRYVDANDEALELFGVGRDELRRHCVGDFAPRGLGPIHRALFVWVARTGRDFGGGTSTIVRPNGKTVRVDCPSIEPCGGTFRIRLEPREGEATVPHSEAVASILEAWREAERDIQEAGHDAPEYDLARTAAASLRDIYQFVVHKKEAALAAVDDV